MPLCLCLEENKIIPKEWDVTSPMNLKARRPMKTVKLSNQLNNNKLFARLKSIDQELNWFSSTRKSVAQNLEGNKNDTISQKIGNHYYKLSFVITLLYLILY